MLSGRPNLVACLVFAAGAAVVTFVWVMGTASFLGYDGASAACALGLVVLHPLFVAPSMEKGLAGAALALALAAPIACVLPGPFVVFGLMPLLLGIVRSAVLYPAPLARALIVESGLGLAGLLVVLFFYDGSLMGTVFALWSFWLIQAVFALLPTEPHAQESTAEGDGHVDPFDRAREAALMILDRRR